MHIPAEVGIGQGVLEPLNLAYRTLRIHPSIAPPLWVDMLDETLRHPVMGVFTYERVQGPLLSEVGWYGYSFGDEI